MSIRKRPSKRRIKARIALGKPVAVYFLVMHRIKFGVTEKLRSIYNAYKQYFSLKPEERF